MYTVGLHFTKFENWLSEYTVICIRGVIEFLCRKSIIFFCKPNMHVSNIMYQEIKRN